MPVPGQPDWIRIVGGGTELYYGSKKLVEPVRLPQQIAKLLTETIRNGTFPPGSGLPSEKQISTDFSVSRSVVREAISILKYDGLVETKQGSGVFVSANPYAGTYRIEVEFEEGRDKDLRQLFELRLYVESAATELAAEHISDQEIEQLRAAARDIETNVLSGLADSDESVGADLLFHNIVSQASGNEYLWSFVRFINAKLRTTVRAGRRNSALKPGLSELVLKEHLAILTGLENRDAVAAKAAMEHHIRNSAQRLKLSI